MVKNGSLDCCSGVCGFFGGIFVGGGCIELKERV